MSTTHSSYWLDQKLFEDKDIPEKELDIVRIIRLAAVRRAVSNFVSILSGKNVPVEYSSGKTSYTDGERVVISADDDPEKFDSMVGLALHEGSHVLLTDFIFIKTVLETFERRSGSWGMEGAWVVDGTARATYKDDVALYKAIMPEVLIQIMGETPKAVTGYQNEAYYRHPFWERARTMFRHIKDIMNILEDRRIDQHVYRTCGGYRPYYDALYNRYFFTKDTGKNLKFNPEWRELTIDNYVNRLLLAFHPDADHDALPGLRALVDMMDLPNIDRVAPTYDYQQGPITFDKMPPLWKEACKLYAGILTITGLADKQKDEPSSNNIELTDEMLNELLNEMSGDLPNLDPDTVRPTAPEKDVKGKGTKAVEVDGKFNDKKGKKELEVIKNIMDGKAKKKNIKKAEKEAVDAMETANAKMVNVTGDGVKNVNVMVTRKVTDALIQQEWFIFGNKYEWVNSQLENAISAGRRMGAILHNRLQVRNDPQLTKQTRLPNGGLDRRLLAQLGMDITSVFQKSRVDIHKPVILHLSLDASGSMSGSKWHKVVSVATAIAYLSKKLTNVETVISIRGSYDIPIVAILFDSRKDSFPDFMKVIRKIHPAGSTPEGLCFKATLDLVLENTKSHDVYFINFSDGEPSFSWMDKVTKHYQHYSHDFAANHTKAQIKAMRDAGVKVLSYFITESNYHLNQNARRLFTTMYGQSAEFVNIQNAGEVLRTLNKLLLNRGT